MSLQETYLEAMAFLRELDEDWARLIDAVGPCLHDPKAAREPYEALVRAVAYQQISVKAGDAILSRLINAFGGEREAFPTAARLAEAEVEALRACGFSAAKAETLRGIASGALSGVVPSREEAAAMEDEALIAQLTQLKGIGRWTVEMLLMYSLERGDVLPVDDLGVREGYRALRGDEERPKPKQLREFGEAWSPHRTVASWYLWRAPEALRDAAQVT